MTRMMLSSCFSIVAATLRIILLHFVVIAFPLVAADNYNGTCDDQTPPWTELTLEKGQFEKVVYSSLYENVDCSGQYWGTGVSMNFEGINCAPSPDGKGNICFRCIDGALSVSLFDWIANVPDINATTNDIYLEQANVTVYINCADGCGYSCYQLGDDLSMRVGWNSNDQPLCSNASEVSEACADVSPPQPPTTPAPAPTTTSSSSLPSFGYINILLSSLIVGLGNAQAWCLLY